MPTATDIMPRVRVLVHEVLSDGSVVLDCFMYDPNGRTKRSKVMLTKGQGINFRFDEDANANDVEVTDIVSAYLKSISNFPPPPDIVL